MYLEFPSFGWNTFYLETVAVVTFTFLVSQVPLNLMVDWFRSS